MVFREYLIIFHVGEGEKDEDNDGEQRVNVVFYFSIFNKKN